MFTSMDKVLNSNHVDHEDGSRMNRSRGAIRKNFEILYLPRMVKLNFPTI